MGLFSNRVDRESLKPGDHIYSWRTAFIYAHHGIYVGDDKVIHFTRHVLGREVENKTVPLFSSLPIRSGQACPNCTPSTEVGYGVISSCLTCFLAGDRLHRFEYFVSAARYRTRRAGTCTTADSDPDDDVVHRAKCLLDSGFGDYKLFTNNCKNFAIYCKTGLVVMKPEMGQSGLAASFAAVPVAAILRASLHLMKINVYGIAGACVVGLAAYYGSDIGTRKESKDVVKMSVEDLINMLRPENDAEAPVPDFITQQEQPVVEALQTTAEIERGTALDSSSPPTPTTQTDSNTIDLEDAELRSNTDDERELEDEYLNAGVHREVDLGSTKDPAMPNVTQTNSSITSVDYSLSRCVTVLDELEDIDDNTYFKALEKFTNYPDSREIFLSTNRKRAWLNRLV